MGKPTKKELFDVENSPAFQNLMKEVDPGEAAIEQVKAKDKGTNFFGEWAWVEKVKRIVPSRSTLTNVVANKFKKYKKMQDEAKKVKDQWETKLEKQKAELQELTAKYGHRYVDQEKGAPFEEVSLVAGNYKGLFYAQRSPSVDLEVIRNWASENKIDIQVVTKSLDLTALEQYAKDFNKPQLLKVVGYLNEVCSEVLEETSEQFIFEHEAFNETLFEELKNEGKIPAEVLQASQPFTRRWKIEHLEVRARCAGCGETKNKAEQKDPNFVCKRCGHK